MAFTFANYGTNPATSSSSLFGAPKPTNNFAPTSTFPTFGSNTMLGAQSHNPMKSVEVMSPPEDAVSCLEFSPATLQQNFLVGGSWDNKISCWEITPTGTGQFTSVPKAQQSHAGPILDTCWSDDGTRVFTASCDKTAKMWDLGSNQMVQVAAHDAPIKTCHWIKGMNYSCLMTGSWDKTLKFWDTRSPNPMTTIQLTDKVYAADVVYPLAVVCLASKGIIAYNLNPQPQEMKRIDSQLKYQIRCVSIFNDKKPNPEPVGFALGSIEGRVAIHYNNITNPKDNFTFKCHRSNEVSNSQDVFAVNDITFHPQHGTLATVGSDGKFSFWDKDARTKLKTSEQMEQPITSCSISSRGELFAYSVSYDWSKGHEYNNTQKKNYIFIHPCYEDLKFRNNKK